MIFKIVGSVVVLISSYFLGYVFARDCTRRPQQLRELQSLLQMFENQITYLYDVLVEAFEIIHRSTRSETAVFFQSAAEKLRSAGSISASQAWEEAVRENIKRTSLNKEDEEILVSFGKVLGSSDIDGQVRNIRLTLNQLQLQEQKAEDSRNRNERMYRSLGLLGGVVVVILLL